MVSIGFDDVLPLPLRRVTCLELFPGQELLDRINSREDLIDPRVDAEARTRRVCRL